MKRLKTNTHIGDTIQIDVHGVNIRALITNEKIILYEEIPNRDFRWLGELDNKTNSLCPKNTSIRINKKKEVLKWK